MEPLDPEYYDITIRIFTIPFNALSFFSHIFQYLKQISIHYLGVFAMNATLTAVLLLSTTFEAGCAENTVTRQIGTNVSASLVSFTDISQHENTVSRQADALSDLSQDFVRASMIKGAKIGTTVGCGLALVSAATAKNVLVEPLEVVPLVLW
jgi:hypothetical protein